MLLVSVHYRGGKHKSPAQKSSASHGVEVSLQETKQGHTGRSPTCPTAAACRRGGNAEQDAHRETFKAQIDFFSSYRGLHGWAPSAPSLCPPRRGSTVRSHGSQHHPCLHPAAGEVTPPARQPFYLHHAACWQLPPLALLKNPAGHAHSHAHGGPICRTSPCTARKTSGSTRCQVCCCPAAAPVREGNVPAGEGLSPVPMHTPGDSPPAPIPSRSPTISPTGLPASSPLRRSTPCSGAAASRRTPPFPGARAPTPRQTPARGQLLLGGC